MRGPFSERLRIYAKYFPKDRIAIVYGDLKISWRELNSRVNRLAQALLKLGVTKGTKCGIMMHNRPEFIEANFGIQKLGAVPVPINYRFTPNELSYILRNSDSEVIIFESEFWDSLSRSEFKPKHLICLGDPIPPGTISYRELISNSPDREPKSNVEDDDIALICYTGGTTGFPKGVVLSYGNLVSDLELVIYFFPTLLPPVSELDEDIYAKNTFQRKLFNLIEESMMTALFGNLAEDPVLSKSIICMDADRAKITLAKRGGRTKPFWGLAPKPDLLVRLKLGERAREISLKRPMAFKLSGRIRLLLGLLKDAITGSANISFHGPLRLKLRFVRNLMRSMAKERVIKQLLCPPLFHMAGYGFMLSWFARGGTLVMPVSRGFDPREILELIQKERVDWVLMVPTQWQRLISHPDIQRFDLSSVKLAMSGGALFRGELKRRLLELFPNALLFDGFGQTEMSPLTMARIDAVPEEVKDRCIGKPLPGLEIKIVDEQGNEITQPGIVGEIIYRGPTVMQGYYKDPAKTREAIRDGWFYSGDLGYYGEDGQIYIVERKTECIISGAEKIYPEEVEDVIRSHPKVEEVCVIGIPDREWGQAVRAVVQLKPGEKATEQEIIDWCRGKIAGYKKPKSVVFTDKLPLSAVGKIHRAKVKELYGGS